MITMHGVTYTPQDASATAGTVVFFLINERDGAAHNMWIGTSMDMPPLVKSKSVLSGHSAVFTVHDLPAGTYTFWCTIMNHAATGMVGTLTVTP